MERVNATAYFDGFKLGGAQKFFLVIAGLTYAFDMMDMALFGVVAPVLTSQYGITNEKLATLNFLFFIGSFLGSIISGIIADKYGRKNAMCVLIAMFSLGCIGNALWQPSMPALLEVTRFVTGFGTTGAMTIAITFISEMLPSEKRGKYQSTVLGIGTFSIPFIAVFGAVLIGMSPNGWRYVLAFGGGMLLLLPVAMVKLVESPRWLIKQGRVAEAEAVMEKCIGMPCDMSGAYENYKRSVANAKKISTMDTLKMMCSKDFLQQTLVCLIFAVALGAGNNMMSSYSSTFLVQMSYPLQMVLIIMAASSFGQPIGELLSALFSDKGGRTIPLCVCSVGAGCCFLAMGYSISVMHNLVLLGVLTFIKTLFACGAMALLMTYIPESFPTSFRSSATGFIYGGNKLGIAIFSSALPVWAFANFGWFGVHGVNAAFWFVGALVIGLFGKKTALKNIDLMHCEDCSEK